MIKTTGSFNRWFVLHKMGFYKIHTMFALAWCDCFVQGVPRNEQSRVFGVLVWASYGKRKSVTNARLLSLYCGRPMVAPTGWMVCFVGL